jgi:hypothetical protein
MGISGNCVICGTWRYSLHRDHIVPKFKGGSNELENIQLLCANCHEDKTREDLTGWPLSGLARMAQAKAQTGKTCSDHRRASIKEAHRRKIEEDPDYLEKLRFVMEKAKEAAFDRICDVCGMQSRPGSLGTHQRWSGHTGYTEVLRASS